MIQAKALRIIQLSLVICSAFILCTALGMLLNPDAFHKFFSPVQLVPDPSPPSRSRSYYWDVKFYGEMVLSNRCYAFYPLWPLLTRFLFNPQTLGQAAHSLLKLSSVIFFASTPLFIWIFLKALKHQYLAFLTLLAFWVSPMAIFRVIGYTESLFSLLSVILLWLCLPETRLNENIKLVLVFMVTFIMSLNRPILIPVVFASCAALATIFFFARLNLETRDERSALTQAIRFGQEIKLTFTLLISSFLGYSMYGLFCWSLRGDFLAPFKDQRIWGTKLGLHPELLFFPKSPLFDLLGLYFSVWLLLISLAFVYFKIKKEAPLVWVHKSPLGNALLLYPPLLTMVYILNNFLFKNKLPGVERSFTQLNTSDFTQSLSRNYIFWFCAYFPVVLSVLTFFTRDRLYSLGRFVFGVPFFFVALGYLCCCIPGKKTYQALWWFIVISAVALVEQWVNYGHNRWLG
jgi:hypothetical protein